MKAVAFQIVHLLMLRRDDLDRMTGLFESGLDFAQRITFARARAAAKQRDEIARGQNMFHRFTLLIIQ